MRRYYRLMFLSCLLLMGATQCKEAVKPDVMASALEAGDYTALVEGCGNQLVSGYSYCRMRETQDVGNSVIYFVVPPVTCLPKDPETGKPWESCATVEIFFPNGEPTFSVSFPRQSNGQSATRVAVKWKDLVKRNTFEKGDRGFWPYRTTMHWIDADGRDQRTITEGEIRLRVVSPSVCTPDGNCKSYLPSQDLPEDANYVWNWIEGRSVVKMTTSGRVFVGAVK